MCVCLESIENTITFNLSRAAFSASLLYVHKQQIGGDGSGATVAEALWQMQGKRSRSRLDAMTASTDSTLKLNTAAQFTKAQ